MNRALASILSALLLGPTFSSIAIAATSVEELAQLVREQENLQRQKEEHETSLRLLRVKGSSDGAILSLEEQMSALDLQMMELKEKELLLRRELAGEMSKTSQEPVLKPNQETLEVQRIKLLLTRYYTAEEAAKARGAVVVTPDMAGDVEEARDYDLAKVLLSGAESISAIRDMSARLESESVVTSQREVDIIYHIEVRRDGSLVSSKSYSLKALGRSQYVGKVELGAGDVEISVKTNKWSTPVDEEAGGEFLVTLSTPFDQAPELHLIPVQALLDTGWEERPDWLPYIGSNKDT